MKERTATHGIEIIAIGKESLKKGLVRVSACQNCSAWVSRPFGSVLLEALGEPSRMAEYVVCEPAQCPNCRDLITETTLVRCEGEREEGVPAALKEFEQSWEETNVILIDETLLAEAQSLVAGCERCMSDSEMTFDYILDALTGYDPAATEYLLSHPAQCSHCGADITEKTLVVSL